MTDAHLREKAASLRRKCVETVAATRSSHIGGVLSMLDLATYLFYEEMRSDDRFVLSKGHAALALYAVLHDRGVLSDDEYHSYLENGSLLVAHASHHVSGVDVATGSLGHGPAIAAGLAWSFLREGSTQRVYCLLGDGECQEGTVWEAIVPIVRMGLVNLTLVVDANDHQGFSDRSSTLFDDTRLIAMLRASGLQVSEVDGHDFGELRAAFAEPPRAPRAIVARTVKGKGVSYMEDRFEWHYKSPTVEELRLARDELR